MPTQYLIVGGGIAGTTAAEILRKNDRNAEITIVGDEPHRLYSRVLLSKPAFLTGAQKFDSVWMKSSGWYQENRITLKAGCTALSLEPSAKTVRTDAGETLQYDKLLLAFGTHNRQWGVKGATKNGVHYLRTLDHARSIIDDLRKDRHRAVMVGSACVTYEVADILRSKGIDVTEVMRESYFWEPSLSREEASIVEGRLADRGITIIRNMEIEEILGDSRVSAVSLKDGRVIDCDIIFAFIGVELPTGWLSPSGIALERGVLANEYLETSLPDVWVAGDIARYKDSILDDTVMMGNWMNAVKQGETAALNMLGGKNRYELVSFHSSHGFGDMISFAGDVRMREGREYILRGSVKERRLGRLIIRENRIVGSTMVNRTGELNTIVKLIASKMDVSPSKADLTNPNFDLRELLKPKS